METKDLIGKYVHFKDNLLPSLSTLNGGLTFLHPSSLFYLKIETAEKYKDSSFILLTGTIVDSCGQLQMFPKELINSTDFDMNSGKADDEIRPIIAHIANPDFLEVDEIDDGIIVYKYDSKHNVFEQYNEKIYVPCIVSHDELSKLFTEKDSLSYRYFFGLPLVNLPVIYDNNNEGKGKVICFGTTLFQNDNKPYKHNLVQLYYSKTQNLVEYGSIISKYLDIPFYYGQLDFDKSILCSKI